MADENNQQTIQLGISLQELKMLVLSVTYYSGYIHSNTSAATATPIRKRYKKLLQELKDIESTYKHD